MNRTDRRNLAKQFHGIMLAALAQQIASRLLTHRLQQIQLLIERSARRDELRVPGSCLTILPDAAVHRRWYRCREWPSFGRVL